MARRIAVAWAAEDSEAALHARYRAAAVIEVRTRLHALWLLRRGEPPATVAAAVGVGLRSVHRWLQWYREGGLAMVCGRRRGGPGKPSHLTPDQQAQVVAAAARGMFATAAEVRDWIEAELGGVLPRGQPVHPAAAAGDPAEGAAAAPSAGRPPGPNGLEKRGLGARLKAVGLRLGQGIVWGDEMKLGLRARVRKVWAPRGVAVSQAVQIGWKYTYVAVAVDPMTGRLWWAWQANMMGEEMARIWRTWAKEPAIDGRVWDGVGGHRGQAMQAVDAPRVVQPPHAPEPDPVERFFRELRRAVEGRVHPDLQAKQAALEPILNAWRADPERVKKLCGWGWIRKAPTQLPATPETP